MGLLCNSDSTQSGKIWRQNTYTFALYPKQNCRRGPGKVIGLTRVVSGLLVLCSYSGTLNNFRRRNSRFHRMLLDGYFNDLCVTTTKLPTWGPTGSRASVRLYMVCTLIRALHTM